MLRPEVDGRVATITFADGASVSKGDILVELDSSVERAELAQAQAQLILARSNFERAKELRRNNAGTQRALDEADAALRTADAMIDLAQARLSKRRLVAPFDARVGLRTVSPGDFVTADTKIVNLEQTDPLKVDFRVPEIFLPALAPGQKIALEIDAYRGTDFTGTVRALDPLVDAAGRAVVVRAEIKNDDGKLRPGLFARVRLTLSERQNALFVPEQSIQPQGDKAFRVQGRGCGRRQERRQADRGRARQSSCGRGRGHGRALGRRRGRDGRAAEDPGRSAGAGPANPEARSPPAVAQNKPVTG